MKVWWWLFWDDEEAGGAPALLGSLGFTSVYALAQAHTVSVLGDRLAVAFGTRTVEMS